MFYYIKKIEKKNYSKVYYIFLVRTRKHIHTRTHTRTHTHTHYDIA